MVPCESCSGVKVHDDCFVFVANGTRAAVSNRDRRPYSLTARPRLCVGSAGAGGGAPAGAWACVISETIEPVANAPPATAVVFRNLLRRDRADDAGRNTAHISRHGISPEDVEEALTSNPLVLRGPDGRYLGYGKSADGRCIFVPFVQKGQGIVRPITARPMTDGEKRLYRKKRGKR